MKPTRTVLLVVLAIVVIAAAVGLAIAPVSADPQTAPETDDFIPSEELPSDSAVAFPVDI